MRRLGSGAGTSSRRLAYWSMMGVTVGLLLPERSVSVILCNETYNPCEELLWKGSECRQGVCSNPFEKGCLHGMLSTLPEGRKKDRLSAFLNKFQPSQSSPQIRVCSSDDPPSAAAHGLCINHTISPNRQDELYADYREIRIVSQNWESSYFSGWILQIILSELLQVPTTIESGTRNFSLHNNFYDPWSRLEYGDVDNWNALERANQAEGSDCRLVVNVHDDDHDSVSSSTSMSDSQDDNNIGSNDSYRNCGNVVMEFWNGIAEGKTYIDKGVVENMAPLGAIGQIAIFIPKFTAEADPTLLNLHGIQGEANRRKLAATFKRPTTWKDYCELVSPSNCTKPDDVAQRPPLDDTEYDRMHVPDLYTGHFRYTDSNNCTANPNTCTGHIADFPCGWISFVIPQMYHNNIALKSDGDDPKSNGYTYQQLSDMWAAANATESHLMSLWWTPEAIHSTYMDTRAEMHKISLAWPTQECYDHRVSESDRCDYDIAAQQVGDPRGACDEGPQMLYKGIVKNLYTATYDPNIPEAKRSPAYDTIKLFSISELQQSEILRAWINRNIDKWGFDLRLATCEYVVDHLDLIESIIPRTYPRVAREGNLYEDPFILCALVWASLVTLLTIVSTMITYARRDGYAIRYAQLDFLMLLLLGLFLVCLGAVVQVTDPNNFSCSFAAWLVVLGYTIQLVPTIVKVSAIHKLMKAAQRLQRLELPKTQLFGAVAVVNTAVVIFLICWTAIDPRKRQNEFFLSDEVTEEGETIVTMGPYCSSGGAAWNFVVIAWYGVMMAMATVLAFKTRHIREEFNESKTLGVMTYAHFLFLVLLVASLLFSGALAEAHVAAIRSLIFSCDSMVTLLIYFLPKFTAHREPRPSGLTNRQSSAAFSGNPQQVGSSSVLNANGNGNGVHHHPVVSDFRNNANGIQQHQHQQPGSSSFFSGSTTPHDTSSAFSVNRQQPERSPSTDEGSSDGKPGE